MCSAFHLSVNEPEPLTILGTPIYLIMYLFSFFLFSVFGFLLFFRADKKGEKKGYEMLRRNLLFFFLFFLGGRGEGAGELLNID